VLERILEPSSLKNLRVLVTSFEHMKPQRREYSDALARWVKKGGTLIYVGDDSDRFGRISAWWNKDGETSATPREDLWRRLGLNRDPGSESDSVRCGKGRVIWKRVSPKQLAADPNGAEIVMDMIRGALGKSDADHEPGPYLCLERSSDRKSLPYLVGAVMDEAGSTEPLRLQGLYADLFTSNVEILRDPVIEPGEVFLLRKLTDYGFVGGNVRLESVRRLRPNTIRLSARGSSVIERGLLVFRMPEQPVDVRAEDGSSVDVDWDEQSHVIRIRFPNKVGSCGLVVTM